MVSCSAPDSYNYGFYFEFTCQGSIPSHNYVYFDVAETADGPWIEYDMEDFYGSARGASGTIHESNIPSNYQWYRFEFIARWCNTTGGISQPDRICGTQITLTPTNTHTPTRTPTFSACLQTITEGFESGTLGMFSSSGSPGWTTITNNPHSGAYAAYVPDVGYVSDQQLTLNNALVVPLNTTQATLSFWQRYNFDVAGSAAWDGGVLEISANGGPWNDSSIISGGYNGVLVNCPSLNPLAGRQAWVGSTGGWVQASVDLTPYRGMSMRFRFREGTSETVGGGGWWIDDVAITFTQSFCWTPTTTATPCSPVPCTATRTSTVTYTPTPTCPPDLNYTFTPSSGATIVPGTADLGNHCDDCVTNIALPFSYNLYGTQFTSANVSSNGNVQFVSGSTENAGCLPSSSLSYAIIAYLDDLRTDMQASCPSCGIFTSESGTTPNRIFNIEWRTIFFSNNSQHANFEVRLYEGQYKFDVIYGQVDSAGGGAAVGVQLDNTRFTQYSCDTANLSSGLMVRYMLPNLCPPTFTSTPTPTVTPCSPIPCTDTPTWTTTRTRTPTNTSTPTATICGNYIFITDYNATIVPGVNDIGNHCDDCMSTIALPFSYSLYGIPFSGVIASSNGNIQFNSAHGDPVMECLPSNSLGKAILPYSDNLRTDQLTICQSYGMGGCGIFTSLSGTAPNRILNIEWRTSYSNNNTQLANFEVRLYEGQARFDVIYGRVDQGGSRATIGVQSDMTRFSQYSCTTPSVSSGLMTTYVLDPCLPSATSTITNTLTPTRTLTSTPIMMGHVTWQGHLAQPNILQQLPVTLTLKLGANEVNYPAQITDVRGFFTLSVSGLASGTYNWRVKGPKYLANGGTVALTGQPLVNVEMGLMRAGDANDNNTVNTSDFNIVKTTFGLSSGNSGYDDRADFTGDQWVNIADFNLLKVNFGQGGAPPIGPDVP